MDIQNKPEAEGDELPGLADYICDHSAEYILNPADTIRLRRIQMRMAQSDYFDTDESRSDLAWLRSIARK
jgi:hypothetical protein